MAAYIIHTGVYLVRGVSVLPERPTTGLMIGFLCIAIGQTAGAPIFGLLMDRFRLDYAVWFFACIAFAAVMARRGQWGLSLLKSSCFSVQSNNPHNREDYCFYWSQVKENLMIVRNY